jgi:hypothetical protein
MRVNGTLKVLSSEMDPAESRLIRQIFIKGSIAEAFKKIRPSPNEWELFNARAPSRTVIALNGQMRSKAHTARTAPLVLHHTRIYKCAMKKLGFNGQMRNEPFLIVI